MRFDADHASATPVQGERPASEPIDRLLESDHRIANNLGAIAAIVRLESSRAERENYTQAEVRGLLAEVAGRIDVTARLHRALVKQRGDLDSAQYLTDIAQSALAALDLQMHMRLQLDLAPNLFVPASRLLSIGMIVNEAVTNAVKYAHPSGVDGRIDISSRREGHDGLFIVIEDDGVGLPPHFDTQAKGRIGFKLMRALAAQCGAQFTHRSSPFGLRLQVVVPPT